MPPSEIRAKRKAQGLCTVCGKNPLVTMAYCEPCRVSEKKYKKQFREYRKVNNICVRCSQPAITNNIYCIRCRERNTIRSKEIGKKRYEIAKDKGICVNCYQRPAKSSRVRCEGCTKSVAKSQSVLGWMNKFNLYLEMGGKCVACGNQELRVLVIDHVYHYNHHTEDNGKIWNKLMLKIRQSTRLRAEVLQGYKEGKYQLLCSNCNRLKEYKRIGCDPYIKLALEHKYYPNDRRTYDWRNKFDLLAQMGGCCFDCGVRELAALEIHHSKLFHHSIYQKEWESIRVKLRRNKNLRGEILSGYKHGKYFLLCCNCNRRDAQKQIGSEPFIQEALARLDRAAITNGER